MAGKVNALRALAGAAMGIGGLIRSARLNEATLDARDARRKVEDARKAFDDYMATTAPDAIVALRMQVTLEDAQSDLNDAQRVVDSIQSEEALWSAAGGTAMALDGLGVGNGDGGGGGGNGGGDGGGGDGVDGLTLLTAGIAGLGGGLVGSELVHSRRGRSEF